MYLVLITEAQNWAEAFFFYKSKNKKKLEVADYLSVCFLKLLFEKSTLPSLVAINLVKVDKIFFQFFFLTHFFFHCILSLPPENIKKPYGIEKGCIGNKWV